jgi:predicted amidophosphoribosyltransferase
VRGVLLSETCAACGAVGPSPCRDCRGRLRRARGVPVPVTGTALDVCRALLVYEGPGRELVARLKYRNDRRVLAWLADGMAALLDPPAGTVVTWIPTTDRRRRRRGFDQARLLARAVARRWNVPCHDLLARQRAVTQTGRSLAQRQGGVPLVARRGGQVDGPVVLVDDVVTTGASLRSGAAALRRAGVPCVSGLAAAATPRRRR